MTYKIGDENMTYSEEIKKISQKCFLSQEAFWARNWCLIFICQPLGRWKEQTKYVSYEKN